MADKFRPVNPMLGSQPHFGPIPAEQLVPWTVITFIVYSITQNLLGLSWNWTILLIFWGNGTWWVVTGSKPYRFLSKFVGTPNWTRGRLRYSSVLAYMEQQSNPHPTTPTKLSKSTNKSTKRHKLRH